VPAESAAKDALKKAANDFAAGDYATALARLDRARATCGVNRCARVTKALVLRDLGTMQFRSGDKAAAANSFAEALKIEPDLDLPSKYAAADIRAAWDKTKGGPPEQKPLPPPPPAHTESPSKPAPPADEEPASVEDERPAKPAERAAPRETYARLWLGVAGAIDLLSMPAANDACLLGSGGEPTTPSNLYCTNPDGTDFPSRASSMQNSELVKGQAGQLAGGFQPGDVRAMLSVDYALNPNVLVGGRLGYVANSYTGSAASKDGRAAGFKIHVEGRATYLLGANPLARAGFAPMGFAGLGLAEFDGHATSVVTLSNVKGQQPVDVWRTDGPFFVMLGGGARYQFSTRAAFTGALRLNVAIGNGALVTYGPEIGLAYGF
jgi:hypothetical protein